MQNCKQPKTNHFTFLLLLTCISCCLYLDCSQRAQETHTCPRTGIPREKCPPPLRTDVPPTRQVSCPHREWGRWDGTNPGRGASLWYARLSGSNGESWAEKSGKEKKNEYTGCFHFVGFRFGLTSGSDSSIMLSSCIRASIIPRLSLSNLLHHLDIWKNIRTGDAFSLSIGLCQAGRETIEYVSGYCTH